MHIRCETPTDAGAIHAVIEAAFEHAEHSSGTEAAIVAALRDAGALTVSLIAEDESGLLGHAAFSPVVIEEESRGWFGLGPVSVLPTYQRYGIGGALIRSGLERLKTAGASGCVVLGDPGYYRRFGFASDPAICYADVPPEYFQYLSFGDAHPRGRVEYHAAFAIG